LDRHVEPGTFTSPKSTERMDVADEADSVCAALGRAIAPCAPVVAQHTASAMNSAVPTTDRSGTPEDFAAREPIRLAYSAFWRPADMPRGTNVVGVGVTTSLQQAPDLVAAAVAEWLAS
jgi:hypothetical protein